MSSADQRPANPFPGLRSFEPEDHRLFFGREAETKELLSKLRQSRFLTVVGASGSGKSSIVRAGLIPSLSGGDLAKAGTSWRVAIMRPADDPIGSLVASVMAPGVLSDDAELPADTRGGIETRLRQGERSLAQILSTAGWAEDASLLLVVDQFEELFRFTRRRDDVAPRDESDTFVEVLLEAAHQTDVPIYVVLSMRSGFLSDCTRYRDLPSAINKGLYLVPRLSREQRKATMTGPVAFGGAQISARLVARILDEVGEDPDQLPIVQHALMRTWDYWQDHHTSDEPIDLRHYEAIGGSKEALSLHAEEAFHEFTTAESRRWVEAVFKNLTEKGQDGRGVRRPMSIREISAASSLDPGEVRRVVECFRQPGRSFLMPAAGVELSDDTVVDISHESLMRIWNRLRTWVDEEAQSAARYQQLATAAERHHEGKAALWRDPELQIALTWQQENQPTRAWALRYDSSYERAMTFLQLSRDERDRRAEQKELARERRLRRTRAFAMVLGAAALVALVLMFVAGTKSAQAEAARAQAEAAREEAVEARVREEELRESEEKARLLAQQQEQIAVRQRSLAVEQTKLAQQEKAAAELEKLRADQQADNARRAEAAAREQEREAKRARETAVAEREIAKAARDAAVRSDLQAKRLRNLELARSLAVQVPALQQEYDPSTAALVALEAHTLNRDNGGFLQKPEIFDALRSSLRAVGSIGEAPFAALPAAVRALAVDPQGDFIYVAVDDKTIRRYELAGSAGDKAAGTLLEPNPEKSVRSLAMSSDGKRLAAGGLEGGVTIWWLERPGSQPDVLEEATADCTGRVARNGRLCPIRSLDFSRDGDWLAAGTDKGLFLWRLPVAGQLPRTGAPVFLRHELAEERVSAVSFGADGTLLAGSCAPGGSRTCGEGSLWRWRLTDAEPVGPERMPSTSVEIRSLDTAQSGGVLAAGHADGSISLYDSSGNQSTSRSLIGHRASVNGLSFSPDGTALASASSDGTVRVWPLEAEKEQPLVLLEHSSWVWAVAFEPGGLRVVSASDDRTVRRSEIRVTDLAERICPAVAGARIASEDWGEIFPPDVPPKTVCAAAGSTTAEATGQAP